MDMSLIAASIVQKGEGEIGRPSSPSQDKKKIRF
jgi:hypothetical protein